MLPLAEPPQFLVSPFQGRMSRAGFSAARGEYIFDLYHIIMKSVLFSGLFLVLSDIFLTLLSGSVILVDLCVMSF